MAMEQHANTGVIKGDLRVWQRVANIITTALGSLLLAAALLALMWGIML